VNVCRFRGWFLYALHVRTNHVHGIVDADVAPSRIFNDWKAYATRALNNPSRIHWSRGGGTRRIQTPDGLVRAMSYVLNGQGESMQTYCGPILLLNLIDVHIQRVADPEPDHAIRVYLALGLARYFHAIHAEDHVITLNLDA